LKAVIFVDTSVLLDVLQDDPRWSNWSAAALDTAAGTDTLAINDIIYAELSTRYARLERLDAMLAQLTLVHLPMPQPALFLAAKAFLRYRAHGGTKSGVLSDFFVGAHAAVEGAALVTRDTARVRAYFPSVRLVSPGDRTGLT